jgi:hypothetical protein
MNADVPMKKLLELQALDLLPLAGDRGVVVKESVIPELVAVSRRLDFVLKLERKGEVFLRHVEFQTAYGKDIALRVHEYATALAARYELPVASTVIVLTGRAPQSLLWEERVGGRWMCRRRIKVVRLAGMAPAQLIRLGPGGAALAGLAGPPSVPVLEAAARCIEAGAAQRHIPDLLTILRMLSDGRYTASELERVVPRGVVMASNLIATIVRRTRAETRAEVREEFREEGREESTRTLCSDLIERLHPAIVTAVRPHIDACRDAERLRGWLLAAPQATDEALLRLIESEATGPVRSKKTAAKPRTSLRTPRRSRPASRR